MQNQSIDEIRAPPWRRPWKAGIPAGRSSRTISRFQGIALEDEGEGGTKKKPPVSRGLVKIRDRSLRSRLGGAHLAILAVAGLAADAVGVDLVLTAAEEEPAALRA